MEVSFPFLSRSVVRLRPLVTVSIVAAALLLAGCSSSGPDSASPSPSSSPVDLCSAAAASGAESEAVTVTGDFGTEPTATFAAPLKVTEAQTTVLIKGSGDPIKAGDLINFGLTAFDVDSGAKLGSLGYTPGEVLPAQISPDNPLGQVFGCATPGSRVVATFPASDGNAAQVYVFDLLSVVPDAAWGDPQAPVDGMPTVKLAKDGEPTITIPSGDAPSAVQLANLKTGDGATVGTGDTVLVQYTGVKWSDGTIFDSSWEHGTPASFATTGVVPGFQQALEGHTVGSQVLVVIPPAFGYGEKSDSNTNALAGETLVFVVDILGVQHATAAAQ